MPKIIDFSVTYRPGNTSINGDYQDGVKPTIPTLMGGITLMSGVDGGGLENYLPTSTAPKGANSELLSELVASGVLSYFAYYESTDGTFTTKGVRMILADGNVINGAPTQMNILTTQYRKTLENSEPAAAIRYFTLDGAAPDKGNAAIFAAGAEASIRAFGAMAANEEAL